MNPVAEFCQIKSSEIARVGDLYPNKVPAGKPPLGMIIFTDPVLFPANSSLIVGRLKLLVRNSSNLSGRSVSVTKRS